MASEPFPREGSAELERLAQKGEEALGILLRLERPGCLAYLGNAHAVIMTRRVRSGCQKQTA